MKEEATVVNEKNSSKSTEVATVAAKTARVHLTKAVCIPAQQVALILAVASKDSVRGTSESYVRYRG